jgi:hypothetical protein
MFIRAFWKALPKVFASLECYQQMTVLSPRHHCLGRVSSVPATARSPTHRLLRGPQVEYSPQHIIFRFAKAPVLRDMVPHSI